MWVLLCVVLSVIMIIYSAVSRTSKFWKQFGKIPGPTAYPFFGHVFEFSDMNPETLFLDDRRRSKDFFPIYKIWGANLYFVGLLTPEDIELVVTNTNHNAKNNFYNFLHGWLGTGLLTSSGSKWQTRRKILTASFHFNILQEFVKVFNEETKNLINELMKMSNDVIDVVKPITEFTLVSIADTAMGTKLKSNAAEYKNSIYEFGNLLVYRLCRPWLHPELMYNLSEAGRKEQKIRKILHDFSTNVIQERKKTFKENINTESLSYSTKKRLAMLDLLLSAKESGENIDDEGIREEVDTFMFEGHDTTSMAICYTLMILANNKEIQNEIYREILEVLGDSEAPEFNDLQKLKYMERCIKECLRLYPSVPYIGRTAGEDIHTHSGYTIPKGCFINIYIYDLHRNPEIYPDPEKFDPDRFLSENVQIRHPFAYLPFSAGSRNCIGQKFALLEIKAVLCGILRHFVLEPVDRPQDMVFLADLVLRPKGEIRVKFVSRNMT